MSRDIAKYQVFQQSHRLVLLIYKITHKFPVEERYGLVSQMRRSAYSIPMNLIEGGFRATEAEFRHFVNMAYGSCAEIQYQLTLVHDLVYISENEYMELSNSYREVGKMLNGLIRKLKAKG